MPTNDCGVGQCDVSIDAVDFCHATECWPLQRWEIRYAIPNLPTNEFLLVRTIGLSDGEPDTAHETWAPLIQYNVVLSTAARACTGSPDDNCLDAAAVGGPAFHLNVNILSRGDYRTIPGCTAGLPAGVSPGKGVVAGEIHDCTDVRIKNAQIGFAPLPLRMTYFNGNPVRTLPDLARREMGTEVDGLFAGFDLPPGPIHVVALGNVGDAVTLLGEFTARIWPDTVTIVGLNGGKLPQP